jgi:hypothetical protein
MRWFPMFISLWALLSKICMGVLLGVYIYVRITFLSMTIFFLTISISYPLTTY